MDEGRNDEPPGGLLALAVRLDVMAILEVLMDHLALERAHRLERNRAPSADGRLGSLICGGSQRRGAPVAVAGSVDHHRDSVSLAL